MLVSFINELTPVLVLVNVSPIIPLYTISSEGELIVIRRTLVNSRTALIIARTVGAGTAGATAGALGPVNTALSTLFEPYV